MLTSREYRELTVVSANDPIATAARLTQSGICRDYMLYERNGTVALACGAAGEITATTSQVRVRWGGEERLHPAGDIIETVSRVLRDAPFPAWRAYGWTAFELAYATAGWNEAVGDERLLHLVIPETEVVISAEQTVVRSLDDGQLLLMAALVSEQEHGSAPASGGPATLDVASSGEGYRRAVRSAIEEFRGGRLQKVILSRLVPVDFGVDLAGTYVEGRRRNNPARSFLFDLDGFRAVGFSPETVVEVEADGHVVTQPLAGTRALTDVPAENARLRADLLSDAKEIYEHCISVKVAYDELSVLCEPGSVAVGEFMAVKERGTVQHLGSTVTGRLAPGHTPWDAFRTVFPAITASGIPKTVAYECIHRLETEPRGLYGGAVLTLSSAGDLDAALVLRTAFQQGDRTWLRAGAGIVEQSTPEREFEETCEKLRSVATHLVPAAAHDTAPATL
ncbi:salicylate synthase [Actinoallomurus sp. NPDC052308]|uniref:salicylate synthase n=1 Tax=Actinoallomurus sp. NPDC052308 TaxID=3155530 RepID=UPI00341BB707